MMSPYFESKNQSVQSSLETNPLLQITQMSRNKVTEYRKPPIVIEQVDDSSREPSFIHINNTFDKNNMIFNDLVETNTLDMCHIKGLGTY